MGDLRLDTVDITLNDRSRSVRAESTVSDLIATLDLQDRLVVVERNGEIVPRSNFASTVIAEGDTLEIVHFVGGG